MLGILWTILVIAVVVWLLGLLLDIGGSLIHVLLIIAAVILIYNMITGRRAV
ncbi:MAG TPA: lmo0937 family membrane protein [Thermomicrobiales bacterium]|nr:lmo0937 family membrane protein [Thermomicrobiales bacterium]